MKLNERSIPNRVENVAVGFHPSFDACRYVWTRISESDPVAGSGRQKHGRGKMKFRRRANSNDNAIRAESLLKTDDRVLELVFWSALADDLHTFLGEDRLDLAVSVP